MGKSGGRARETKGEEESLPDKAAAVLRTKAEELREMRDRLMLETKGLQKRMLRLFRECAGRESPGAADDWRDKLHIRSKTRGRKEDQR